MCWWHAFPLWLLGKRKYLIIRWSYYIWRTPHCMVTNDLKDVEIEEAVPVGPKRKGWAGVWHALTADWTVRKGKDE